MRLRAWTPFCLLTLFILSFSTDFLSGETAYVAVERQVTEKLGAVDDGFFYFEQFIFYKGSHSLVFFLLALATFPVKAKRRGAPLAMLFCGLVALGSEVLQAFTTSHQPAVLDVAIDLVAAILGLHLLFCPPAFLERVTRLIRWSEPALPATSAPTARQEVV